MLVFESLRLGAMCGPCIASANVARSLPTACTDRQGMVHHVRTMYAVSCFGTFGAAVEVPRLAGRRPRLRSGCQAGHRLWLTGNAVSWCYH